jgi:hypothetical protein
MAAPDFTDLVAGQRAYFHSSATRPVEWRREQLQATKATRAVSSNTAPRSTPGCGTYPTPSTQRERAVEGWVS